ncbi:hypothetical protein SISNIDRAFT_395171, partial [Sistotremastrum niveocremeum HHB9708]
YEYLPPYSPDFNPIELAFAKMKKDLRKDDGVVRALMDGKKCNDYAVLLRLLAAMETVTNEDAAGYFRHCGY